jgi:glyoxylase-like metal-dependent hydrolase (beta-lactamase superfamily II)
MKNVIVGDITVKPVVEDPRSFFDPTTFFPDLTREIVEAERSWMEPHFYDPDSGNLVLNVQGFVFEAGGRVILMDTCVGNHKQGRNNPGWNGGNWPWLENLQVAGYAPEDIDVVLCTHLHVDHAGWHSRLENGVWVPTFPNAEYLSARDEMAALEHKRVHGSPQYAHLYVDSILPVIKAGQSVLVDSTHKVADGVQLEPSPGHTPGHVSIRLNSKGAEAVAIGDMMHHPIQALYPQWNSRVCEDAELARRTRREFLQSSAGKDVTVLPGHFMAGRVKEHGEAFRFEFDLD